MLWCPSTRSHIRKTTKLLLTTDFPSEKTQSTYCPAHYQSTRFGLRENEVPLHVVSHVRKHVGEYHLPGICLRLHLMCDFRADTMWKPQVLKCHTFRINFFYYHGALSANKVQTLICFVPINQGVLCQNQNSCTLIKQRRTGEKATAPVTW